GNSNSVLGQVSANGRYVVFQSDASDLVAGDTNKNFFRDGTDIFLRDVVTGTTRLISVAVDGGFGNGPSTEPVMTPDATCIAFISSASNLVAGDTNNIPDVFVRDLLTQTTWLATPGAVRSSSSVETIASPVLTPDGRFVAWFSTAGGLTAATPTNSPGEVYIRDRFTGVTRRASVDASALAFGAIGATNVLSCRPKLSDDGRYVSFKAATADSTNSALVLRYDSLNAVTAIISTNGIAGPPDYDEGFGPEMTLDGRYVAYVKSEGPGNLHSSVHFWDSQTLADALVSGNTGGVPTNTASRNPLMTPNGRFVLFLSNATNLVSTAVSNGFHIYRRDLYFGMMDLVDKDTNGVGSSDDELASLSMSADGRFVAFSSPDGGLVDLDKNNATDVIVRDVNSGRNELISRRDPTVVEQTAGAYGLSPFSVSADGRYVTFMSMGDDLVLNDTNNQPDAFVRDLQTGTTFLASAPIGDASDVRGSIAQPVISANGRYVAFISMGSSTNSSSPTLTTNSDNLYLYDLQSGTTALVSVNTNGLSRADGDCSAPVLSQNGRYVAFLSLAGNMAGRVQYGPTGPRVYWRDMQSGVVTLLNPATNGQFPPGTLEAYSACSGPSISRDGRYVAYGVVYRAPSPWGMRVWDSQANDNIYLKSIQTTNISLSPDGGRVLYQVGGDLYVDNVATGSNLVSIPHSTITFNSAPWSDDGRYFAFVSSSNFASGDDGTNKVYLYDLVTGTLTLVGVTGPSTGSMHVLSDGPVLSGDGRFVAFRSGITNTIPGDTNSPPSVFLFDRSIGASTVLTRGHSVNSPVCWASRPAISSLGNTVAFLDLGSGLAPGDLNRMPDAFAASIPEAGTPLDSDGDGIPDWWMLQMFGHATGLASDLSRAGDDADLDGMSNLQEYLAGTIPTNSGSVLQVRISQGAFANGVVSLSWPALLGRNYQVQYKGALNDPTWLTVPGSAFVAGGQGTFALPVSGTNGFYRVGVSQ
ncbi:MAG TPA: hypothetical protein VFD66_05800, partial [Verrucomicrobiae bacterium]|nr:hypothetical protein [Verrucomicrobiae bacterium]